MALHAGAGRGPGHLDPLSRQGAGAAPTTALAHLGVSFTQDFSLEWSSGGGAGSVADSSHVLVSIKLRGNASSVGVVPDDNRGLLNKCPAGSNTQTNTAPARDAEHPEGALFCIDNSAGNNGGGIYRWAVGDTSVVTNNGFLAAFAPILAKIKNMEYVNVTMAVDTNHVNGQKLGAFAIDGVQVNTFVEGGTWGAGVAAFSAGKFMVNTFVAGVQGACDMDVARVYFDTPASMSDILDPAVGVGFAAGFLAKEFVPGTGSLDIGPDGSGWTGSSPLIFHEVRPGGVATDILVNHSTNAASPGNPAASAFSGTTSALLKAPYLASIHPEEKTGGQPYMAWLPTTAFNTLSDSGGFAPDNCGQEIRVGDLVCVWFSSGGTGARAALACHSPNGGAWALLAGTSTGDDFSVWGRAATSSDVTAQGQAWNSATKPTITWTAGSGFGGGGSNATAGAFCIRKPSGAAITVTTTPPVKQTFSAGSVPTAAAITPVAQPALLFDMLKAYGWQYEGNLSSLPSGMIPRWKRGGDFGGGVGLGGAWPYMFEKRVASTSQIPARAYPQGAYGNNAGAIITLLFS